MTTHTSDSRVAWPGNTVLVGSALALALVIYGGVRFPASITAAGAASLLIAIAGLAAYGTAGLWSRRSSSADVQSALRMALPLEWRSPALPSLITGWSYGRRCRHRSEPCSAPACGG
jgi:hypothetical protein